MVHGVRIVDGYHGNELGRYDAFLQQDMIANPTVWALLNTEFLLVNTDSIAIPGVRRVVGPVRDAAGTIVTLYELPGEHPFSWVAPVGDRVSGMRYGHPKHPHGDEQLRVQRRDIRCGVEGRGREGQHAPAAARAGPSVTISMPTVGHIALTLSDPAPKGSALVVSENYYPGWHATVDGKPATAERADLTLIGIALPEGAKKVELNFSSDTYKEGKSITLAAIVIAILAVLAGLFVPGQRERAA